MPNAVIGFEFEDGASKILNSGVPLSVMEGCVVLHHTQSGACLCHRWVVSSFSRSMLRPVLVP